MGSWFIRKLVLKLRTLLFTSQVKHQVQQCGVNLNVRGRVRIINEGLILISNNVILDSSSESSIKIKVGKRGKLVIGSNVYINEGTQIICNLSVEIHDYTKIASGVLIIDDDFHPLDPNLRKDYEDLPNTKAPITINENVWIGSNVILLKGVTVGMNSVIGAGSVLTKSVPENVLAAGNPAKEIRKIS